MPWGFEINWSLRRLKIQGHSKKTLEMRLFFVLWPQLLQIKRRAWKYSCSRTHYSIYLSICLLVRPLLVSLCVYPFDISLETLCCVDKIFHGTETGLFCSLIFYSFIRKVQSWIVQNSTNWSVAMNVWPGQLLSRTFLMWCCLFYWTIRFPL